MSLLEAMSTKNLPSLTERLPVEILQRIFLFTPVQDILRLSLVRNITEVTRILALLSIGTSKVNTACRSIVQDFPSIRYKIDHFAAGLKHNPRTEVSLADCSTALWMYRRRWETLGPTEKRNEALPFPFSVVHDAIAVCGTYGIS